MDCRTFLETVVTTPNGWFLLALSNPTGGGWKEEYFEWPNDIDKIVARASECSENYNVYFSSYLFSSHASRRSEVLPSRTIQADLDEADILTMPIQPTVLVQSSPGRHQGYWVLSHQVDLDLHETLSRKMTYAIKDCDHTGWPIGRRLRLPDTLNHKYSDGPKPVIVSKVSGKLCNPQDIELLAEPIKHVVEKDNSWIDYERKLDGKPQELLESIKHKIPSRVYFQYNISSSDRSTALWSLMTSAFRAGLDRDAVWTLAWHSANNKFARLNYNAHRELAKDVLRAEDMVRNRMPDARTAIMEGRKMAGLAIERRNHIQSIVIDYMSRNGEFIHSNDDSLWYIAKPSGRPISISDHSKQLNALLDIWFGLNPTEIECTHTIHGLQSHCMNIPPTTSISMLSHYDADSETMLLHSGRGEVIRITAGNIERVPNGSMGVIFPWNMTNEPFIPKYESLPGGLEWDDILFDHAFDSLLKLNKKHAKAVIKSWFIFLLFKSAAVSRPVVALFGEPGSGKTCLFKRVYMMLYGRYKALDAITTPDKFDHVVSNNAFVVFDNVDTWEKWLPDRIALSAGVSDISKRKLYTDDDTFLQRRQAMIGVTAHNPKFGREDVADRLLLFNFERLRHFLPESEMMNKLFKMRNVLWGNIVQDVQKVIKHPQPDYANVPQFRIEDFARMGYWIASALNIGDDFHDALNLIKSSQRTFTIEEEAILISAMNNMLIKAPEPRWRTATEMWSVLSSCSSDPTSFNKIYHNAVGLGKKLYSLQESLKTVFNIEWRYDAGMSSRQWMVSHKHSGQINMNGEVKYGN